MTSSKLSTSIFVLLAVALLSSTTTFAFTIPSATKTRSTPVISSSWRSQRSFPLYSSSSEPPTRQETTSSSSTSDPMEEEEMDSETRIQLEKQRRAQELREQEVFMKRSTGKYTCTNCDWEYDEAKGDSMMIGGMIKPGTKFEELPSNWRCPVCRASKDSFAELTEEIPGFEVNQGYGFGGNSMTSGQKNAIIFGGLGFFFLLFLSGYALS